jgi:hypothetical protein
MGQVYTVPANAGCATGFAVDAPMYCMGLASNFALHLELQKKNFSPMCSEWWTDWVVTAIPQTGSFNAASAPVLLAVEYAVW